jgi:hypothetical protein
MLRELNSTDQWSEFMSRMRHQFEELLESKPACLQDMVQELREHEDSITFLDIVRDSVPTVEGHRSDNPPDLDAASRLLCLDSRTVARLLENQKAA